MGNRMSERFGDDDYFAEPNYDKLSDEELDELYYFGELRSAPKKKKAPAKAAPKKPAPRLFEDDEDDEWLDADLDDDLFEED